MGIDVRKLATEIIDANVPGNALIFSDGPTEAKFTQLCGGAPKPYKSRQEQLVAAWATVKGKEMTLCNEFVTWYAGELARKAGVSLPETLGRFDIEQTLTRKNAWVKSATGLKPQYGDILRHTRYHMDVSLGVDADGVLWRVAAGQGGPPTHDIIRRVKGTAAYNAANLQGWIDIDLYFNTASAAVPAPEWLLGWWKVIWRGQAFHYYFFRDGTSKWTQNLKQSTRQPPVSADGTGTFTVDVSNAVTIQWPSGSVEKFTKAGARDMRGTWTAKDTSQASLTASKL